MMLLPNRRLVISWQALESLLFFLHNSFSAVAFAFLQHHHPLKDSTVLSDVLKYIHPIAIYQTLLHSPARSLNSPIRPHLASWSHKLRTKLPTCLQRSPPRASTWGISLVTVFSCRSHFCIFALPTLRPMTLDRFSLRTAYSNVWIFTTLASNRIRDRTAHTYWHFQHL